MTGSARRRVRPIALAVALVLAAALALWAHTRDRAGPGADAEAPPLHPLLRAGPVVGWVEDGRAWLWVQTTRPARVEIALDEHNVQSASTDAAGDHIAVLEFSALAPGRHSLALRLDGEPVGLAPGAGFVVPDATAADFAFTFGSCLWVNDGAHGPGGDFELLDALAAEKADFMLWLGDNVHLLYDLGTEGRHVAEKAGAKLTAAEAVNTHPAFIKMLVDGVELKLVGSV